MILTYNDFYNQMGLVQKPLMNPNPAWLWAIKAWIGMGNRAHGDNLAAGYKTKIAAATNYAELTTNPWQDATGWVVIFPAADNTCTNAVVKIYDFQIQWFDKTDQKWKLLSAAQSTNRVSINQVWWGLNTFASEGSTDRIYLSRYNIPSFSNVKLAADRTASSADVSKYRIVHNGVFRAPIDYTKVGAIAVMCRAKIEPISGSFNGTPSFMMHVGADYNPQTGFNTNEGWLAGVADLPAVGSGQFTQLSTDEKPFLFVSAKINPNTFIETTSDYMQAHPGEYASCMTDADFRANVPQFMSTSSYSPVIVIDTQNITLGPRAYVPTVPTGAVKYVTPTGSGSHNGSSWANAMTLAEANTAAVPGDHYWLADGVYVAPQGGVRFYNGGSSSSAYVTYEGASSGAIVDGLTNQEQEKNTGIQIQGSYIRLINVEQKNSSMEGVKISSNCTGCIVDHVHAHHNKLTGIQVSPGYGSAASNIVRDCISHDNSDVEYGGMLGSYANGGNADGIQAPSGTNNVIEYCLSYGNSDDGIDGWRGTGATVRYCISHSNGLGAGNGNGFKGGALYSTYPESTGNVFDHCLAYNNKSRGFDNNGSNGTVISNLTSYGNTAEGFYFETTAIARNNVSAANSTDFAGTPATNTGNTWNIGGTPAFKSTTPGNADFLKLDGTGGFGQIGCFYP